MELNGGLNYWSATSIIQCLRVLNVIWSPGLLMDSMSQDPIVLELNM